MSHLKPVETSTPNAEPVAVIERDQPALEAKRRFNDGIAQDYLNRNALRRYFHDELLKQLRFLVPPGASVLEVGCGVGTLLGDLEPTRGLGIDFSPEMIRTARQEHPELEFRVADAHTLEIHETFDFVILSNLVGELIDIQQVLSRLPQVCHDRTRIILTHYNYLWAPLVRFAERLGLKPQQPEQNWLEIDDLSNLLELSGLETVRGSNHVLSPVPLPLIGEMINGYLGNMPLINRLCINHLVVARPRPESIDRDSLSVSVVVACKDERGNIEQIFRKTPKMGRGTELIFVDGHSEDGTVEEIERCIGRLEELNPELDSARVFTQPGTGKGDAVRLGFAEATGDVLMILDADITVRPEDLPKFFDALVTGKGEFINGSRLVYPMEDQAMRLLNMLANHFFGWAFSWLLDQQLTDTLCGTKVLFRRDYEAIEDGRAFFGDFDPFGDFDLLFGAAKLNLKIREVPIRYRNREYGDIKISRFKHGLLLLRMSALGFRRFKLLRQSGK
jgi:SAM-dependent methyltransferase